LAARSFKHVVTSKTPDAPSNRGSTVAVPSWLLAHQFESDRQSATKAGKTYAIVKKLRFEWRKNRESPPDWLRLQTAFRLSRFLNRGRAPAEWFDISSAVNL
jgi:hypothetical protein